ncbi:hypothetical protein DRN46_06765, partial [Thermococci archaeon]
MNRILVFVSVVSFILLTPTPFERVGAHMDRGDHIVTEEVVLDYIVLIACDEVKHECQPSGWGPYRGEDLRIYTKFSTQGHHVQSSFFAFPDNMYSGVCKEEYLRGEKGDKVIIGKTVFFHVDCNPPEKFNYEIWIWDDDSSWDLNEITQELSEKAFGKKDVIGRGLWGAALGFLEKAITEVFKDVFESSHDNEQRASEVNFDSNHVGDKQFLIKTKLTEGGDLDWEKGDIGSEVYLTVKITHYKNKPCNIDSYKEVALEYIESLEIEKEIEEKLKEHIERTYSKARNGDLRGTKIEINEAEKYAYSIVPDEMSIEEANKFMIYEHGFEDFLTPKFLTPQGIFEGIRTELTDEHTIYYGPNDRPIAYTSNIADQLIDEQVSESGGYYIGEPPKRRAPILKDIPKLKPLPGVAAPGEIPGYDRYEEEDPPKEGIAYTRRAKENEKTVEEETVVLVPKGEKYEPCEKAREIVRMLGMEVEACPPPKENYFLAGYHKYEHGDGAKEVEGFGLAAPSNKGYEEIIFAGKYTIVCIYEPLESLEELLPKFTEEDCPEPKP